MSGDRKVMESELVKLSTVTVRQYGERGFELTLPRAWVEQSELSIGDEIDVFVNPKTRRLEIAKKEKGI